MFMYIHNIKINKPITEYIKTNNARELRNEIAIHVMYIEDIQWFDVEYGIYFTRDGIFHTRRDFSYFHECKALVKKRVKKFHLIQSKNIEFSVYYIFFVFVRSLC